MFKKFLGFTILILALILPGSAFSEELNIAYANMRKIFYEYKKTKEANKELEKEDEKIKSEIEAKTQGIRKLRDELDLLSEKAKEKKGPELKQKLKELDEFRKGKIEEFIRKKDELFKEIRGDILDVAETYSKNKDYDIVFDEAIFVYSSEKYDITDDIIKELNK